MNQHQRYKGPATAEEVWWLIYIRAERGQIKALAEELRAAQRFGLEAIIKGDPELLQVASVSARSLQCLRRVLPGAGCGLNPGFEQLMAENLNVGGYAGWELRGFNSSAQRLLNTVGLLSLIFEALGELALAESFQLLQAPSHRWLRILVPTR